MSVIVVFFFFSSRRRHTRCGRDWSSDVCSSDLPTQPRCQREGAVGLVLAGLVEAAHAGREHGLERIDADFADLDQCFAEPLGLGIAYPGCHRLNTYPQLL